MLISLSTEFNDFYILSCMHKCLIIIFVLINLFTIPRLTAIEVHDLYQASVPVISQASSHRKNAIKRALQAVMVKVGGKQSVLLNDTLKQAIVNNNLYLTQYLYQRRNNQLLLVASFNEQKVNQLFLQANLPIWGILRPQVLLWLIDEQGLSRTIMSNSTRSSLPSMVANFSNQRGLPIIMPLMDLTDATQVNLSDMWGKFEQPIQTASQRYFAEAIVVMRISDSSLLTLDDISLVQQEHAKEEVQQNNCGLLCVEENKPNHYALDWTLYSLEQRFSQQYQGNNRSQLLTQGLSDITELIYKRYALSSIMNNDFIIEVANVNSLKIYTDILDFLTGLSAVKSATLVKVKGKAHHFSLQLLGSEDALLASLQLNKQLKQYIDPLAGIDTEAVPVFYWGGK